MQQRRSIESVRSRRKEGQNCISKNGGQRGLAKVTFVQSRRRWRPQSKVFLSSAQEGLQSLLFSAFPGLQEML